MEYRLFASGQTATELILFFNGWAMTPESVTHLQRPEGCDLLVVWDYRDPQLSFDFTPYQSIQLAAWSMGVWAADAFFAEHPELRARLRHATAVCGTGYPMDDALGIPEQIFRGTLEGLTEENRLRFNRRMCGGKSYKHLFEALAQRSTQEIYDELAQVLSLEAEQQRPSPKTSALGLWQHAFIGEGDRIIPAENQERYWQGQGVPYTLVPKAMHYLLGEWTQWEELWK